MANEQILVVPPTATSGGDVLVGALTGAPAAFDEKRITRRREMQTPANKANNFDTNGITMLGGDVTKWKIAFPVSNGISLFWTFATSGARDAALDDVIAKLEVTEPEEAGG